MGAIVMFSLIIVLALSAFVYYSWEDHKANKAQQ